MFSNMFSNTFSNNFSKECSGPSGTFSKRIQRCVRRHFQKKQFKEIFKNVQNVLNCFQAKSKLAEHLPNSKLAKLAQISLNSTKSTFAAGVAGAARVGFSAHCAEASGTSSPSVFSSTFSSAVPLSVGSKASGTFVEAVRCGSSTPLSYNS